MQGSDQQAYDRGSTIFSPDGRLYQVEYAREAVGRGLPAVGVRAADGVALVAAGDVRSPLQVPDSVEKLHRVDDHLAVASAGHVADARKLVDLARREAQVERVRYGESVGVETLTKTVTDHLQEFTQKGGARPYGTALLVGGVHGSEPRLFETDPSGTPSEWRATAIGDDHTEIRAYLEDEYDPQMGTDAALDLAFDALDAVGEVDPGATKAGTVTVEEAQFEALPTEQIESRLA